MAGRVCVIVNPAAGRGRGARRLPRVESAFRAVGVTDVWTTTTDVREGELTRRAIAAGFETVVAVGGDGTWGNVANAILDARADCRLGIIAAGTGNDFAKTVGAPARDCEASARLAVDGADRRVDVGGVENRCFLNVFGAGFDIAVLDYSTTVPWLRGDALYVYSALRQLVGYRGVSIDVRGAGGLAGGGAKRPTGPLHHLMLIVANAQRFGGAFHIAPQASIEDGLLDAVAIYDAPALRRLSLFVDAVRGAHTTRPGVQVTQSAHFTLSFATPPAYELDGERYQATTSELAVQCVPKALRVVGARAPAAVS